MLPLTVNHLTFSYDKVVAALRDVSFTVGNKEIVGLVGPNGSGKSTLIRCIFDIIRVKDGDIQINGHQHSTLDAKRAAIYLSSEDDLPDFLTGHEYLALNAEMYGQTVEPEILDQLATRYALNGRLNNLVEDYSHGMKKKLQLISALMLRRPLTVIDETLNGIDIESLYFAMEDLKKLRDDGLSVLLCTHDFRLLDELADRLVLLHHGELVLEDTVDAVEDQFGSIEKLTLQTIRGETEDWAQL